MQQVSVSGANRHLNFVLAGYNDPMALPGAVPNPETARKAYALMRRRAFYEALGAGIRILDVAEDAADEALSRTLLDIGESKLAERYRPAPHGVRPYVNRIIRCRMGNVVAELRGYGTLPRCSPASLATADPGPVQLALLHELSVLCDELLKMGRPVRGQSAGDDCNPYVRKHRDRKWRWQRIDHLFPEFEFRPRRRPA